MALSLAAKKFFAMQYALGGQVRIGEREDDGETGR
jgi:hypothetical protein